MEQGTRQALGGHGTTASPGAKFAIGALAGANEQQALQDAQKLQAHVPTARAMRSDKGFFVVLGNAPTGETEALLAAARAKKLDQQLKPVLVEVKP